MPHPLADDDTLFARLLTAAAGDPGKPGLIDGERTIAFADYAGHARAFGQRLLRAGVRHGDRVAMILPNSAEYAIAILGASSIGAISVLVNARYTPGELDHILGDSRPAAVIAAPGTAGHPSLRDVQRLAAAHDIPAVFVVGAVESGTDDPVVEAFPDPVGPAEDAPGPGEPVVADDPAILIYTSGTTGVPKGAMLSHRNLLASAAGYGARLALTADDRISVFTPMHHAGGTLNGVITAVWAGATAVMLDRFDPGVAMERLIGAKVTVYLAVPTMLVYHLERASSPGEDAPDALRAIITGGSSVTPELVEATRARWPRARVHVVYGLTEAGMATLTEGTEPVGSGPLSVGRPTAGFELAIVDEDRNAVAQGQPGEVALRGPGVFVGYWGNPDATAACKDDQGWLYTGDTGVADGDGRLAIVGRIKDMYIQGATNVYPAEIERVLEQHPAVLNAAVVGKPDPSLGEVGCAFLVARPGTTIDEGDLLEFASQRLAKFKLPREMRILSELPLTSSGKIHKAALREEVAGG